jgi:hypothetical protein
MSGAHVAVHAAIQRKREETLEEEMMTKYTQEDLSQAWEFKILRSQTNAFKNLSTLANVLEEEAGAGWELVEKFDNGRVRLKRPTSARRQDAMLLSGIDPYRTQYGLSEGGIAAVVLAGVALIALLVAAIAYFV